MNNKKISGHISALITVAIWGTTFIATKILLSAFSPIEILFLRFVIGFAVLFALCPKILKTKSIKQEAIMALAGFCGITLYYLLENIALTYTNASNVGVIISAAPFFTAFLSDIVFKQKRSFSLAFFIGFSVSMAGICIISFGKSEFQFNAKGDLLALFAAFIWAVYSVLTKKINSYAYSELLTTKRIFAYGIFFMLPVMLFTDISLAFHSFKVNKNIVCILFLGIFASALCFVMWSRAVKYLGAVKTGVYIYTVPAITVLASAVVLKETITVQTGIGVVLCIAGLLISQIKFSYKRKGQIYEH